MNWHNTSVKIKHDKSMKSVILSYLVDIYLNEVGCVVRLFLPMYEISCVNIQLILCVGYGRQIIFSQSRSFYTPCEFESPT